MIIDVLSFFRSIAYIDRMATHRKYSLKTVKRAAHLLSEGVEQSVVERLLAIPPGVIDRWRRFNEQFQIHLEHYQEIAYLRCVEHLHEMANAKVKVTAAVKLAAIDRVMQAQNPQRWDPVARAHKLAEEREKLMREEQARLALESQRQVVSAATRQITDFVRDWRKTIEAEGATIAGQSEEVEMKALPQPASNGHTNGHTNGHNGHGST